MITSKRSTCTTFVLVYENNNTHKPCFYYKDCSSKLANDVATILDQKQEYMWYIFLNIHKEYNTTFHNISS